MNSDPSEYKSIIEKLLEKTRQRRVEWEQDSPDSFRCKVGSEYDDSFCFMVTTAGRDDSLHSLIMRDGRRNEIFRVTSNDLPTSPEEEEISTMLNELYDLARRQALKVEEKLELASNLLDRT